jgi:anti-sigma factor RsiW
MKHEDEGRLMAYVDGELARADADAVEAHLGRCTECARSATRLRAEEERIRRGLSQVDVASAQRRVRERLLGHARGPRAAPPHRAPVRRPHWLRRNYALQAALFVLFLAGGASALVPGSPLRRLLERESDGDPSPPPALTPQSEEAAVALEQVSVSAAPAAGRLRVSLNLPPGTDLRVVLVEGDRATLFANPNTRFRSADGVLEATVPAGPVRVELPRGEVDVSLEVGGRLYVRAHNGDLLLGAPATDSSDAEFSFRIR